jgi:hypothetical protein
MPMYFGAKYPRLIANTRTHTPSTLQSVMRYAFITFNTLMLN